jgi:tetratricopeptide (TPR) repeat protein
VKALALIFVSALAGCSSVFTVKSDPLQADVYVLDAKSGEKKPLGKTPLELPPSAVKQAAGPDVFAGEFFTVSVEKQGFVSERYEIPSTRFGTLLTALDVKLKAGEDKKEVARADEILGHLFLAQRLARAKEFERAQLELDKLLGVAPEFPRALSMRASIYFLQKNFAESVKWYEAALKADPQLEDAVKMLVKARELGGGGKRVPASGAKP